MGRHKLLDSYEIYVRFAIEKYTIYRLAKMYGVAPRSIRYHIDKVTNELKEKNVSLTAN